MEKGRWINTIYGRHFVSEEQDFREGAYIVIAGLFFLIILLIFHP